MVFLEHRSLGLGQKECKEKEDHAMRTLYATEMCLAFVLYLVITEAFVKE
jgi:hypothetical protein